MNAAAEVMGERRQDDPQELTLAHISAGELRQIANSQDSRISIAQRRLAARIGHTDDVELVLIYAGGGLYSDSPSIDISEASDLLVAQLSLARGTDRTHR